MIVGVGIDLVDIDSFRMRLERTPSLITRLFTDAEAAYAAEANDPTERFAVRFAAKEAFLKSLGAGLGACKFREVSVVRADSGQPSLRLDGMALALAEAGGAAAFQVSLTHSRHSAGAVVIALRGHM